jgi:hypothetical protein
MHENHFFNPLGFDCFWEVWYYWLHLNFDGILPFLSKLFVSEQSPMFVGEATSSSGGSQCQLYPLGQI